MKLIFAIKRRLCKMGWLALPVDDLHWAYLKGHIGQHDLYDYLQPKQLEEFIQHHNEVKVQFDKSEELGLTKTDELPEYVQELVNRPLMRSTMAMDNQVVTTSKERQRMIVALNQLDGRIINKILEREVMARHGKKSVIMDQADYD